MTTTHNILRAVTPDRALDILRAGGLVAVPTETVYGLAGRADRPETVTRIYDAKGRPSFNPLIAHVSGLAMARTEAAFPPLALTLAEAFWPGPLTLVLPLSGTGQVCELARAGLQSIALRCPDQTVTRELIEDLGVPLVAPSANRSGRISPTTASAVHDELGDRIDGILDGGPCRSGIESTVLAIESDTATLLRAGAIPRADLEPVTGPLHPPGSDDSAPRSPGMLSRHYAPDAPLILNATSSATQDAVLQFAGRPALSEAHTGPVIDLSPAGDVTEAAAGLYAALRALDGKAPRIVVGPIPTDGLGEAINDRLIRAARRDS